MSHRTSVAQGLAARQASSPPRGRVSPMPRRGIRLVAGGVLAPGLAAPPSCFSPPCLCRKAAKTRRRKTEGGAASPGARTPPATNLRPFGPGIWRALPGGQPLRRARAMGHIHRSLRCQASGNAGHSKPYGPHGTRAPPRTQAQQPAQSAQCQKVWAHPPRQRRRFRLDASRAAWYHRSPVRHWGHRYIPEPSGAPRPRPNQLEGAER